MEANLALAETVMGIERQKVSSKVDWPCAMFLDWLAERTGGTRSSANNNLIWTCLRLAMQGDLPLHVIALQGKQRGQSSTEFPSLPAPEPSLTASPSLPHQARFNFYVSLLGRDAGVQGMAWVGSSVSANLRQTFAFARITL